MRILHTSDWHFGRIFHGIHMTEDQAYLMDQMMDLIKDQKPDVMIIAGDVFDRSVPPIEAVELLDEVLSRILMDYKIPIVMVAGNHDSPERLGFGYRLMRDRGLYIASKFQPALEPIPIDDKHGTVYFYPLPYSEPLAIRESLGDKEIHVHDEAMEKLVHHIKGKIPDQHRRVLVAHAFVAGGEASESERPLSVGGSGVVNASYFKDFHYVALGHLHRPQKAGAEHIRYSGSLMKYSFAEANHQKCVNMIEMDEKGTVQVQSISLTPKRDLRCIGGYLEELLRGPQNGENREDYLMVTLEDEGAILDPIGKLRKVYPNVLHIERPQLLQRNQSVGPDRNFRKMSEMDLFASFFHQVTEKEMNEGQRKSFEEILEQYYQRIREA